MSTQPVMEGETFELEGQQVVIQAPCGEDMGNWVCLTHTVMFPNQITLHSHAEQGAHQVAWNCHHHGLEQP